MSTVDLTAAFRANRLERGALLTAKGFSLLEAISAVELMDPRMDTGIERPIDPSKLSLEQINLMEIPTETLNAIIDRLLASLIDFIRGWASIQSLFTTVLTMHPYAIKDDITKCLILLMLNISCKARSIIITASVYEDDDFIKETFGISFPIIADEQMEQMYNQVIIAMDLKLAQLVISSMAISSEAQSSLQLEHDSLSQLVARVKFMHTFGVMLTQLSHREYPLVREINVDAKELISNIIFTSDEVAKNLSSPFFDYDLNRHLFTFGPPRTEKRISISDAASEYKTILEFVDKILDISQNTSFDNLFLHINNVTLQPSPMNVLCRSIMLKYLVHDSKLFGIIPYMDCIKESVSLQLYKEKQVYDKFVISLFDEANCIEMILTVFCFNVCTVKRKLTKIVWMLENIQRKLELHDSQNLGIIYWVYGLKLSCMINILERGFGLDLYSMHELPAVFKQLEYLYFVQSDNLGKLLQRQSESLDLNRSMKDSMYVQETMHEASQILFTFYRLSANLCSHLHSISAFKAPKNEFWSAELQYDMRFKPFLYISSPVYLSYQAYHAQLLQGIDLARVGSEFKSCREIIDRWVKKPYPALNGTCLKVIDSIKKQVSSLMKPCVVWGIMAGKCDNLRVSVCKEEAPFRCELSNAYHSYLPVFVERKKNAN